MTRQMTRRDVLKLLLAAAAVRCASGEEDPLRLAARPAPPAREGPTGSIEPLGLGEARDGAVYAAPAAANGAPRPLLLLLHGAGGSGMRILARMQSEIALPGIVIAAPDSRGPTWDIVRGGAGPDVRFIDGALRAVFGRYAIDRKRIAVAGHSDGASYALTLGLANGDLFSHAIAFSPGFLALQHASRERPRIFIAHGRADEVLSFDTTRERIVAPLERAGYDVVFRPFDGGHTPKPEIVREAMSWWSLPPRRRAAILPPS